MTQSLLLTTLPPTSDTDPLNADYPKRNVVLPPLGVITTHPAGTRSIPFSTSTTPTTGSDSECDAFDASTRTMNRTLVACQWTGTPIRAIVPLPRRKLGVNNSSQDATRSVHNCNAPASTVVGPPCLTRSVSHFWDDAHMDSGVEHEEELDKDEGDEGRDSEDRRATVTSRCCSYESITATEGLSAWSFEELRVECYAQSLVARGTKPPPVVQPALAIPPAFVPRFVLRS